ncbi:hypothetical protein BH09SUM1_BH09SUM1_05370 [soil metagenome]
MKSWFAAPIALALCVASAPSNAVHAKTDAETPVIKLFAVTDSETTEALNLSQLPGLRIVNDPIEPFNRAIYRFNDGLIRYVLDPVETGYRAIAPAVVRKKIRNAGYNIVYPGRAINSAAQGKWHGAWEETKRFSVNTTVGVLGLFDPATKWKIGNSDEDFGQTFGHYGAGPGLYLVLPLLGPSNVRNATGMVGDYAVNPLTWLNLWYVSAGFRFNDLSFLTETYKRLLVSENDGYVMMRDAWTVSREKDVLDYKLTMPESHYVNTLAGIYTAPANPHFAKVKTRSVLIPATGKKLPYSYWQHKDLKAAPLVVLLPGIGAHRTSSQTAALAENYYQQGNDVLTISNAYNWEFMEGAGVAPVPGFTPSDAQDVYGALKAVIADYDRKFPGHATARSIMGVSMGGLHALFIAAEDDRRPEGERLFQHYTAYVPPVNLFDGVKSLDEYYNAPLAWPLEERRHRIENALLKAAALLESRNSQPTGPLDPNAEVQLPFDEIESKFLIGAYFRYTLRDIIYASQIRHDFGILRSDLHGNRSRLYDEIYSYSFSDYMHKFVIPYYEEKGISASDEEFARMASMAAVSETLRTNQNVRVFINKDDFLLRGADTTWLKNLMGDRLTVSETGGHAGTLYLQEVQNKIVGAFTPLHAEPVSQPRK